MVRTTPYATAQRIAGKVTRRKTCQPLAPSVAAACSCSVPISRRTGTTSRTTNGSDTKIVASTIPGSAKTTWNGRFSSQPPVPKRSRNASPTTIGESASGRSTSTLTRFLPGNRCRTIAIAQTIPKIVFAGTAMAVMISVTISACFAAGVVTASHAPERPFSNALRKTRPTGAATRTPM